MIAFFALLASLGQTTMRMPKEAVFTDTSRGKPFAKDPYVVRFRGRLLMFYSAPPFGDGRERDGWRVGIAEGSDLDHWKKIGEIPPVGDVETQGLCAPCALVVGDELHLFYQSYGNGPRDAICHAVSRDGVTFVRDPSNPVFRPTGTWNNGRAIDAEVVLEGDRSLLYFATRDPEGKRQMVGVATAPRAKGFGRDAWTLAVDAPILAPTLPWEKDCIEAPSVPKGWVIATPCSTRARSTTSPSRSGSPGATTAFTGRGPRTSRSFRTASPASGTPASRATPTSIATGREGCTCSFRETTRKDGPGGSLTGNSGCPLAAPRCGPDLL